MFAIYTEHGRHRAAQEMSNLSHTMIAPIHGCSVTYVTGTCDPYQSELKRNSLMQAVIVTAARLPRIESCAYGTSAG